MIMLKNKIFVLVVAITVLTAIIWFQQGYLVTIEAQTETPKLTFEVSTRRNSYILREPIEFNLKLSNQRQVPVKSGSILQLRDTNILVRNEAGESKKWEINKFYIGGRVDGIVEMLPGRKMESEELLDGNLAEMMFSRPGRYEVQAEYVYESYRPQRETIKSVSTTFTINILEPKGIDKQAYDFLKEIYEPALRQSDSSPTIELEQNFVDTFGKSVYAKYMILELASIYRGEDKKKALKELCKIHDLDFHYKKNVKKMLLEINAVINPIVLVPLPENAPLPLIVHPCTGKLINPHNF